MNFVEFWCISGYYADGNGAQGIRVLVFRYLKKHINDVGFALKFKILDLVEDR
jgi:hypothetical protein